MKIYNNSNQCQEAAEKALLLAPKGSFIDSGSYRGGQYDCLFILDPESGKEIFSGAY